MKVQLRALPNNLQVKLCRKWNFNDSVRGFNQTLSKLSSCSLCVLVLDIILKFLYSSNTGKKSQSNFSTRLNLLNENYCLLVCNQLPMHYGNMSWVVASLKECPKFNLGNPKSNSGRRSHSGMNINKKFRCFFINTVHWFCFQVRKVSK